MGLKFHYYVHKNLHVSPLVLCWFLIDLLFNPEDSELLPKRPGSTGLHNVTFQEMVFLLDKCV
jgi:hypothetical protein